MSRRMKVFRIERMLLTIHENHEESAKEWAERLGLDVKFVQAAIGDAMDDDLLYRDEGEIHLTEKGRRRCGLYCRPLLKLVTA